MTMLLVAFFLAIVFSLAVTVRFNLMLTYLLFVGHIVRAARMGLFASRVVPASASKAAVSRRRLVVPRRARMCRVGNPFFFKVTGHFRRIVLRAARRPGIHVVHVQGIPFVSSANVRGLAGLYRVDRQRNMRVVLSKMGPGIRGTLGGDNFCGFLKGGGVYSGVGATLRITHRCLRRG